MKRLEIIHLRLVGICPPGLVEDVRKAIVAEGESGSVRIYHHATIANDLGIHLHVEAEVGDARPSDLGVHLAAGLREHGMVEHTVWIEKQEGDHE